jgi:hypothetical protein
MRLVAPDRTWPYGFSGGGGVASSKGASEFSDAKSARVMQVLRLSLKFISPAMYGMTSRASASAVCPATILQLNPYSSGILILKDSLLEL